MEVKIGVTDSPRELVLASNEKPEALEKRVTAALTGDPGVLALTDDKGRRVLVHTNRIAYVDIGVDAPKVGFGVQS